MGNIFKSRRPQPPPPTLRQKVWRESELLCEDSRRVRCRLKDKIAGLAPETRGQSDVKTFNIILAGQIGAGKSSFFNSINSIFRDYIVPTQAEAGRKATSLTKEYRVYEIRPHPNDDPLPWRICDTMGFTSSPEMQHDVTNILKAVDGHVPDGFRFPNEEILYDNKDYISAPELKDKGHCVALVIDASEVSQMSEAMKKKLIDLRERLISRHIPVYVLLTHIDKACVEVNEDVKNVYHSIAIHDLVRKVGRMLHGLNENQIFPIKNYTERIMFKDSIDILLLTALRQMLYSAQFYLENKM